MFLNSKSCIENIHFILQCQKGEIIGTVINSCNPQQPNRARALTDLIFILFQAFKLYKTTDAVYKEFLYLIPGFNRPTDRAD